MNNTELKFINKALDTTSIMWNKITVKTAQSFQLIIAKEELHLNASILIYLLHNL